MRTLIRVAGAVGVEHSGRQATEQDLPGRQPRLAFVVLAWEHGKAISHDELADILWPSGPPSTWQPALRAIVSKVRSMFDRVGLPGAEMVTGGTGRYELRLPEDAAVDIERALANLTEGERLLGEGGVETARRLAGEARTILSLPLLPGVDSPWLDRRREELTAAYVRCLELLGECRRRVGEFDHAVRALEDLLALDPFREPAWRLLMRTQLNAGNAAEALRVYERCRQLMADELGADPAPETRDLHAQILQGTSPVEPVALEPREDFDPRKQRQEVTGAPYRGLEPFDEEHAALFFGREEAILALVDRLRTHRFVAVVGSSGTGKSSLVRAGLLPALASGALPEADTWRRTVIVPGSEPLKSLAVALRELRPHVDTRSSVDRLADDPAALHEAVSAILAGRPIGEQVLIVVDQFEEIFTLCRDDPARRMFLSNLLEATRRIDARTVVVLTMRADFYHRAAMLPDLAAALSTSQFVVPPMGGEGLEQAIEQPASVVGLKFEQGLVGKILTDVAGQPGALPLLQHALLELYERRTDHLLTRGGYDDIGGVSGAVARRAEMVWKSFDEGEREVARRALLRLTEPGEETEDTRRRASMMELIGDPANATRVEAVVGDLADARLVTTSADPVTGLPHVEVAHEALIRGWPRLAAWIDENRAGLRIHRRLTDAAVQWAEHGRHLDYCYSGARLTEAREWAARNDPGLNPLERGFLEASLVSEEAAARRRTRVRRLAMTTLVGGAVIVGILAIVAVAQRGRADQQEQVARSRQVAAEAVNQLGVDPELSLLLAMEAHATAPTAEAEAALRQAVVGSNIRRRLRAPGSEPNVSVSPDGTVFAAYSLEGAIRLWDARTGQQLAELTDEQGASPDGPIDAIAFSPDGRRIAATNLDGQGWAWTVPGGELTTRFEWQETGTLVYVVAEEGVAWAPDGARIALGSLDGRVRLFDASSGELLRTFEATPTEDTTNVLARGRFSPDGRTIAVEGAAGTVALFDARSGRRLGDLVGHEARLWALKFSPDGEWIATASEDATVRIWDASTGQSRHVLRHEAAVRDVAVSPRGDRLLTGDYRGVARLWDAATGESVLELAGHESRVNMVRFDRSGNLGLTASLDGTARIWDLVTGEAVALLAGSTDPVIDAEFVSGGRSVLTAGDDARVWDVPQGAVSAIAAHTAPVFDLALAQDRGVLITGGLFDGTAKLWSRGSDEAISAWDDHDPASLTHVDISPDGRLALTSPGYLNPGLAVNPGPARIWDTRSGEPVVQLPMPEGDPLKICGGSCGVTDGAFSPTGRALAVAGFDGTVRVFDAPSGRQRRVLKGAEAFISHLDWSPDGRLIGVTEGVQVLRVWNAHTGEIVATLRPGPGLTINRVRFHPSSRALASNLGATTAVWDIASGRLVAEFRHRGTARDVAFSPDGKLVVTGSDAGASIWDLESQRHLVDLPGHPGEVHAVRFTADGRIVTGGSDGKVRFFDCEVCQPIDRLLELARQRVTRDLTPAERTRFLSPDRV